MCNPRSRMGNQKRYASWDTHTAEKPFFAGCLPQGDPISQFALGLWMKAGSEAVKEKLEELTESRRKRKAQEESEGAPTPKRRRRDERVAKNYMDDRSWADTCPWRVVKAVEVWQRWSSSVGLKENEEKKQLVAFGNQMRSC